MSIEESNLKKDEFGDWCRWKDNITILANQFVKARIGLIWFRIGNNGKDNNKHSDSTGSWHSRSDDLAIKISEIYAVKVVG